MNKDNSHDWIHSSLDNLTSRLNRLEDRVAAIKRNDVRVWVVFFAYMVYAALACYRVLTQK